MMVLSGRWEGRGVEVLVMFYTTVSNYLSCIDEG